MACTHANAGPKGQNTLDLIWFYPQFLHKYTNILKQLATDPEAYMLDME